MSSQSVFKELLSLLGKRFTDKIEARKAHGEGFSYHQNMPPDYVVFPKTIEEVAEIVKVCRKNQVPIIPYGVGSSVEGHILALKGGVCVDLSLMDKIIEINEKDMVAEVEAGVRRNSLDDALQGGELFFPVGPAYNATLGGMAATRASGTNAVRYGTMKDNVLAMTVVLADGTIIRTGSKSKKSASGYDLTSLFIGSEGTLGIITRLCVKLHSRPPATYSALCPFPTIEEAVNAAIRIIQKDILIAKIELLDQLMIHAINCYEKTDLLEAPSLLIEFQGSMVNMEQQINAVQQIAAGFNGKQFTWAKNKEEIDRLWGYRTRAAHAAQALVKNCKLMSTDVCVPISSLAQCILATQEDIETQALIAPILGHVGDGNFHVAVTIPKDDPASFRKAQAFNRRLVERALSLGGTCSGEHGIGIGKLQYMFDEHQEALEVMKKIKQALDPTNILNPGKLLPS